MEEEEQMPCDMSLWASDSTESVGEEATKTISIMQRVLLSDCTVHVEFCLHQESDFTGVGGQKAPCCDRPFNFGV